MFGKDRFAERNRDNVILGAFGGKPSNAVCAPDNETDTNVPLEQQTQATQPVVKRDEAYERKALAMRARKGIKLLNVCDADGSKCRVVHKRGDVPGPDLYRDLASILRD